MTPSFWARRRVVVTGHTGFKGAWLVLWLQRLGVHVTGLALAPTDEAGAFCALGPWLDLDSHLIDIRDRSAVASVIAESDPHVVFHLAAQPLVRAGYADPVATYEVNVMGTVNLLAALESAPSLQAVVVITTDKVYAQGDAKAFVESDRLGGDDAYSASKACSELVTRAWQATGLHRRVATARAGNVIGGGDVAPDRLLPDTRRAILDDVPLRLRYPEAVRPWQFVLEPLSGYLLLAEQLACNPATTPESFNFGPAGTACIPVREVVERVFDRAGTGCWALEGQPQPYEAAALVLDSTLARSVLGWHPLLDIDEAIDWTLEWWQAESAGTALRDLACHQIERYERLSPQ